MTGARPNLLVLVFGLLASLAAIAPGASADGAQDGGVWHIRIRGDLDSVRLARDFAEALLEAHRDRPGLILVELEADRDRIDVVWMMGRAIRDAEAPVAVWLRGGRDGQVGLGPALLGGLATSCWVHPDTTVATEPGAGLESLMPEDIDLERVHRELRGGLWVALEERKADRRLAEALVAPRQEAWASEEAGVWSLALGSERPPGARRIVTMSALDEPRIEIGAEAMVGLKLARAEAPTIPSLLRQASAPTALSRRRIIRSGLDDAEHAVRRALRQLDEAIELIDRTLRVRIDRSLRGPAANRPYREAGARAAGLVAEAAAELDEVEATIRSYPEILCRPAPGQAALGDESAAQRAAAWRRALESRRRDLDAARARAEDYRRR